MSKFVLGNSALMNAEITCISSCWVSLSIGKIKRQLTWNQMQYVTCFEWFIRPDFGFRRNLCYETTHLLFPATWLEVHLQVFATDSVWFMKWLYRPSQDIHPHNPTQLYLWPTTCPVPDISWHKKPLERNKTTKTWSGGIWLLSRGSKSVFKRCAFSLFDDI